VCEYVCVGFKGLSLLVVFVGEMDVAASVLGIDIVAVDNVTVDFTVVVAVDEVAVVVVVLAVLLIITAVGIGTFVSVMFSSRPDGDGGDGGSS
jgi:hypothetical protein